MVSRNHTREKACSFRRGLLLGRCEAPDLRPELKLVSHDTGDTAHSSSKQEKGVMFGLSRSYEAAKPVQLVRWWYEVLGEKLRV